MSELWRTCEHDEFERQTVTLSVSVLLAQQMVSTAAFVTVTVVLTTATNGQENDRPHTAEPMPSICDHSVDQTSSRHFFTFEAG